MRAFELAFAVIATALGALRLYHALRSHGDFDAYGLGVLLVMLGILAFWKGYSRTQG